MEWWEAVKEWFLSLGGKYNVNPYICGGIYIGAVPFFLLSLYLTIKNKKEKKSILLPVLFTGFFFISAYLYLIIVGNHIPLWVYAVIGVLIVYGVSSTIKKMKN